VSAGRLSEYRASAVVSRTAELLPPLAAVTSLSRDDDTTNVPPDHVRVVAKMIQPGGETLAAQWRLPDGATIRGERVSFDLKPGSYTLLFSASRMLHARIYGSQRFLTEQVLEMPRLGLATNRRFDARGEETTGIPPNPAANALASQLFPPGDEMSPAGSWVLELPVADNPSLRGVSSSDTEQLALGEIRDAVLALEFETRLDLRTS
jgi:hypothetical protein